MWIIDYIFKSVEVFIDIFVKVVLILRLLVFCYFVKREC